MKWILIYVLYSHTNADSYRTANSLSTSAQQVLFDDQQACYSARDGIKSGAFNKSFKNDNGPDSTVTADAACIPQSSSLGNMK